MDTYLMSFVDFFLFDDKVKSNNKKGVGFSQFIHWWKTDGEISFCYIQPRLLYRNTDPSLFWTVKAIVSTLDQI